MALKIRLLIRVSGQNINTSSINCTTTHNVSDDTAPRSRAILPGLVKNSNNCNELNNSNNSSTQ